MTTNELSYLEVNKKINPLSRDHEIIHLYDNSIKKIMACTVLSFHFIPRYKITQFSAAAKLSKDDLKTKMFSGHPILNTVDLAYLAKSAAVTFEHQTLRPK